MHIKKRIVAVMPQPLVKLLVVLVFEFALVPPPKRCTGVDAIRLDDRPLLLPLVVPIFFILGKINRERHMV
jgi:hypothetical protein